MKQVHEHTELWNLNKLVEEYNAYPPQLWNPEKFLVNKAVTRLNIGVKNIICVGCGAGREILPLHHLFSNAVIQAVDIADKMIKTLSENIQQWGITHKVKTCTADVENIPISQPLFQLTICFNNVLTFIITKQKRTNTFKKLFQITAKNGIFIGMVHHKYGTPQKSAYFLLQRILTPFVKSDWGNKIVGKKHHKYVAHYYNREELRQLLLESGFTDVEILSLEEYYALYNLKYNRWRGSNNLIFIATKK